MVIIILSRIEYVLTFLFVKLYFFRAMLFVCARIITHITKETQVNDKIEIILIILFRIERLPNLILYRMPFKGLCLNNIF